MTTTSCKICALLKCTWSLTGSYVYNAFTQRDLNQHIPWYITGPYADRTSGNSESLIRYFKGCEGWCPVQLVQVGGQCMHRSSGGPGVCRKPVLQPWALQQPWKRPEEIRGQKRGAEWAISGLQRYNRGGNWAHCLCVISPAHNLGGNRRFELIIDL